MSAVEVLGTTPRMGRRSMALADIDPKYVSQSGIWEASEVETPRGGSIRIQHLTAISAVGPRPLSTTSLASGFGHGHGSGGLGLGCSAMAASRFPKLEDCAHFHYDILELPSLKITLRDELLLKSSSTSTYSSNNTGNGEEATSIGGDADKCYFSIEVVSGGQCWIIRRTLANLIKLDEQIHRCVWDRSFSQLLKVSIASAELYSQAELKRLIDRYVERLSQLPTSQITCGTVLSWFEIDNRGRHIISSDDSALNTPAVGAGLAIRTYVAQAPDELSFKIGELISVIDMPPPEESLWLRGKLTRESHDTGLNFEVGFFPRDCVEIIGEKGKFHGGVKPVVTTRKLARVSVTSTASSPIPDKPVLRKHGKIISFFRSMMSRPEKHVLQQKGILRERVFNCDLAEHLLNTGTDIPVILRTCAEFIELYGIADGIYRVSGSLRNTQQLRRLFDAEEIPNLKEDDLIRQDVHAVSSLLKQYFRELPNPLCTYQLYEKFVQGISPTSNIEKFDCIKEVIKELPPPHYRTLQYLMLHLNTMTSHWRCTGMNAQNMAIVWAPNLIRCRDLEGGNVAEFKGVSNHVIVTEFVIRYAKHLFGDDTTPIPETTEDSQSSSGRPESLSLTSASPMKLMSLEAAQEKLRDGRNYIEVGGGPSSIPPVYHTVIDTKRRSSLKSKGATGAHAGWRNFFSRKGSFSKSPRKTTAADISLVMNPTANASSSGMSSLANKLRPVKSVESLVSTPSFKSHIASGSGGAGFLENTLEVDESVVDVEEPIRSTSSPATPVSDAHMSFHSSAQPDASSAAMYLDNTKTHNRSISHDSYFEASIKKKLVITSEPLEEESSVSGSRVSLDLSSGYEASPHKEISSGAYGDCESNSSRATRNRSSFGSPITPPTSMTSLRPSHLPMSESIVSSSSDDLSQSRQHEHDMDEATQQKSPLLKPKAKPRLSKLRDCQVQTSLTAMNDVGVSTMDEERSSMMSTMNELREASVGISVPDTDTAAQHRDAENINMELFQYPTFAEIARNVKTNTMSRRYELDRNSSIDDSSTDTTPGGDPYSVTNIVYSPLVNDISSQASSPDSHEDYPASFGMTIPVPASNIFICPLYEDASQEVWQPNTSEVEAPMYENLKPAIHRYENVNMVSVPHVVEELSIPFNHYQNEPLYQNAIMTESSPGTHTAVEFVCEVEQPKPVEEDIRYENITDYSEESSKAVERDNLYETNVYEDIDDDNESLQGKNSYEDIESSLPSQQTVIDTTVNTPCEAEPLDSDPETAYESVHFSTTENTVNSEESFDHHYTEIIEIKGETAYENSIALSAASMDSLKPENCILSSRSASEEDESIQSLSKTEDTVTCLEVDKNESLLKSGDLDSDSGKGFDESNSCSTDVSPTAEYEPIRHIDSPLMVDNPLYGIQLDDTANLNEEVQRMSLEFNRRNNEEAGSEDRASKSPEKLLGRCNSAPLTESGCDFSLSVSSRNEIDNSDDSNQNSVPYMSTSTSSVTHETLVDNDMNSNSLKSVREQHKLLLCKRLSEPSLNFSNLKTEDKNATSTAWKYPDAKRISHRKQSVKELLTRFESQESVSLSPAQSPTRSSPGIHGSCSSSSPTSSSAGPGLPRPTSKFSNNNNYDSSTCLRDRNSPRFPHHRFSMGDILMSQSLTSSEESSSLKSQNGAMTRSDTFPELRNEATKENVSHCRLDYSDTTRFIVPEKVLQVFEVANTTVDNNDPNTRERIEKYKNNRRLFLREKFSSVPKTDSESRSSVTSTKSSSGDRESSSSIDSVFSFTAGQNSAEETKRLSTSDSPRKRALSEDVTPLNKNQFKTFKCEEETSTARMPVLDMKTSTRTSRTTEVISSRTFETIVNPPLGSSSRLNIKSLPGGLREEVISITTTMTTMEVPAKVPWTAPVRPSPTESGKKIKDIAAFFEKKQF